MLIGSNIIFRENLTSTNDYLDHLIKSRDLQEGTIVTTNYQLKGKGQIGNHWESEDGKNLLISILLMPHMIEPSDQFIISVMISAGISDFLRRYIPVCKIKWPNDIYVKDDKIAGILIENIILEDTIEYSIAGIGLNINQKKFYSDAPNPVSLSLLTGIEYDLNICLEQLASDLDYRYKQLISDPEKLKKDYISSLYRFNEMHRFSDGNGIFTGQIISVADSGKLKIEKVNGEIREYAYKEIEFH